MALFLRDSTGLPRLYNRRRGSVGFALLIAGFCLLLLIPLSVRLFKMAYGHLLVVRAHQHVEQVLPVACLCLDPAILSEGQAKVLSISGRALLSEAFSERMPALLADRLVLDSVRFYTHYLDYDPDHWMQERQPDSQPIAQINAILTLPDGQTVLIRHALEILIG
jgi:hypothetical protein